LRPISSTLYNQNLRDLTNLMAIVLSTLIQDSYFTEHFPLLAESNRDTVALGIVRCFITKKSKRGNKKTESSFRIPKERFTFLKDLFNFTKETQEFEVCIGWLLKILFVLDCYKQINTLLVDEERKSSL